MVADSETKSSHRAAIKRFAASAAIALPLTLGLLYLMTQLILPGDSDPIVTRMIRDIELHRVEVPVETLGIQVFELPPRPEKPIDTAELVTRPVFQEAEPAKVESDDSPAHFIDWWAEARRIAQDSDEETLKRWLLEQGYEPYVSIMQGPLPITDPVRATLPPSQEDKTGYLNTYGDMEVKISENCIAQTQVSARNDISDFAKNLPMRVMCKPAPKFKFPFEDDDQ